MFLYDLAIAAALLGADPAAAQPTSPDESIIVEGKPLPTVQQALEAVTNITAAVESQLARYSGAVCPRVVGVVPEEAGQIEARMRLTASQVGAVVAEPGCEPNLLLAIVPNGSQFVTELKSKRPQWFRGVSKPEIQRLLTEPLVRAWSVTISPSAKQTWYSLLRATAADSSMT